MGMEVVRARAGERVEYPRRLSPCEEGRKRKVNARRRIRVLLPYGLFIQ
jgi:hypothetical protein